MYEAKPDWFFIVNPHAGSGKTMQEWVPAERKLYALGIPFNTAYTDYKRHATSLAFAAATEGYRHIMAVGGDGSVHETFNGIMRWCDEHNFAPEEFTLAVAPIGSGNDWIKSLDTPHDVGKVMDMLREKSFGRMDVIRVECDSLDMLSRHEVRYMANVGGTGFDSHVCERVNRQKERGKRNKMIYLNGLQYTVRHLKSNHLRIVADGVEVYSGKVLSVAIGNGRFSGGGMQQVPRARVDDGLLDAMIVPEIKISTILKELPKLFKGNIDEVSELITIQCRELQIIPLDNDSHDIIEIDGEIVGQLPATFLADGRQIGVIRGRASSGKRRD